MEGLKVIAFFGYMYRLVDWCYHNSVELWKKPIQMQSQTNLSGYLVILNLQTHIFIPLRVSWTVFVTAQLHKVQLSSLCTFLAGY